MLKYSDDMLITKMYAGSIAYGTNTPSSDVDFRGIFVAPAVCIRTPFFPIGEQTDTNEEDTKYFELNKFMKLVMDCNPNVVELLWTDDSDITLRTPQYDILRAHAPQLLSSKIGFTTSGYAFSQLKRIKGHNKWINKQQQTKAPAQKDFVSLVHNFELDKRMSINLDNFYLGHRMVPFGNNMYGLYRIDGYSPFNIDSGNLNSDYEGNSHQLGTPRFMVKFNREQYDEATDAWKNYWTWKNNRNVKRSALEEQFGYDTKHAMHLVRLLRIGAEALEFGTINVKRFDAVELLSIRAGAWTYDEVVGYATMMDNKIRTELYPKTSLPKHPNIKLAAELTIAIQDLSWQKKT